MKDYLIDESVIVYLERADYKYHDKLVGFLEGGRCRKNKKYREHTFYMPCSSKIRLGVFKAYSAYILMKNALRTESKVIEPLLQARKRASIAKIYVFKFLKPSFFTNICIRIFPKTLSNLYIYANNAKSQHLLVENHTKVQSDQLVSLVTCVVAMIAHKHNMQVVSFNRDFQYLRSLPGSTDFFIRYEHPDDLLKDYKTVQQVK
jgi:hypothetical protein